MDAVFVCEIAFKNAMFSVLDKNACGTDCPARRDELTPEVLAAEVAYRKRLYAAVSSLMLRP